MYIVVYESSWGDLVSIAVTSSREAAESIIKKLQSAADPGTDQVYYNQVYYNGHSINTCTLEIEYVPEWTEDYLHERGRMS